MSDGQNILKKIAFQLGDKFFRFAINPENMQIARPHRTTAVKTKSRIVVEDFQSDIPTITIEGTTGFNPTGKESDRGIAKIKEMKTYIETYAEMGGNGNTSSEDLYFHDFTNDDSFVIHLSPEGVTYTQDVNQPLLHRYRIKFVILRRSSEPSDEDVIQPEIGNSRPSIGEWWSGYTPLVPNNGIEMPTVITDGNPVQMPTVIIPGAVQQYQESTYTLGIPDETSPINPQVPSLDSYTQGTAGLGYFIGYYGRRYPI